MTLQRSGAPFRPWSTTCSARPTGAGRRQASVAQAAENALAALERLAGQFGGRRGCRRACAGSVTQHGGQPGVDDFDREVIELDRGHLGAVVGEPGLVVERLYEEHAIVSSAEPSARRVGERVRIVPNHACAAVNLHERMLVTQDGEAVEEWVVAARGWGRRV